MDQSPQRIAAAERSYRGTVTDPTRWETWRPRGGDVLVCTPAKCGTTWTQSIIAMLLQGGATLPAPVPVLSPWVDGDLGVPAATVRADLARQTGRRVVKTHTPADGYDIWQGVPVVAVYRHPLDVFLSLRTHIANRSDDQSDHPMMRDPEAAFAAWLTGQTPDDDIDRDTLAAIVTHYRRTVQSRRVPHLIVLHYADMMADRAGIIARLAADLNIGIAPEALARITDATGFSAMKTNATAFAPVAGTGFWKSDSAFFAAGGTEKWRSALSEAQIARFEDRLAALVPDPDTRHWLKYGAGAGP